MKYENLIIDGPYLAHRSWDAPYNLVSNGEKVTMIHSFIMSLQSLRKKFLPNNTSVAWESHGTPSWRRELEPTYKPGSVPPLGYLSQQTDLQIILFLLGFPQYWCPGNEADDVVGTISQSSKNSIIFSVDKDLSQLVNDHCHVYTGKEILDSKAVEEKYKVKPNQIPLLLAITGDSSDNITGFKGYGLKKASDIIKKYPSIQEIPSSYNFDESKLLKNLKLTTINTECELKEIKILTAEHTLDSILLKYNLHQLRKSIHLFKNIPNKTSSLTDFY